MLPVFIAEFIGTFVFITAILIATKKDSSMRMITPLVIGITLIGCISAFGSISGGHFNPLVSGIVHFKENKTIFETGIYIIAQSIGAFAAYNFYKFSIMNINAA